VAGGAGGGRRGSFGLRDVVGPDGLQGSASHSFNCIKEMLRCKARDSAQPVGEVRKWFMRR